MCGCDEEKILDPVTGQYVEVDECGCGDDCDCNNENKCEDDCDCGQASFKPAPMTPAKQDNCGCASKCGCGADCDCNKDDKCAAGCDCGQASFKPSPMIPAKQDNCGCASKCGCGADCDCNDDDKCAAGCDCGDEKKPSVPTSNSGISNNPRLDVLLSDLYTPDCNCQCVNLAVLYNYEGSKEEDKFGVINLPEVNIDYITMRKIFFNDAGKGFSSHVLNRIWSGIKNFSMASALLEHYENLTGVDRDNIPAFNKIQLHKECAISKITAVARRVYGLNLSEFNYALGSVDLREDGKICANVTFHLFFNSLKVGIKVVLRFAISDVPEDLIGKVSSEETASFDFSGLEHSPEAPRVVLLTKDKKKC